MRERQSSLLSWLLCVRRPARWEEEERRKKNDGKEKGMKKGNKREGEQERKDGIKKEKGKRAAAMTAVGWNEEGERRKKIIVIF